MPAPTDVELAALATRVVGWLGIPSGHAEAEQVPGIVGAVVDFIRSHGLGDPPPAAPWYAVGSGSRIATGAVLFAGRLVRRRNSPGGIEAFAGAGDQVAYVRRTDPDVAILLGLDGYRRLVVG